MVGKQIEYLRRKKGLSQAELARLLHISPSTIGMYEQGRREPPINILIALSEEFGVTIDYIVTGKVCTLADPRLLVQTEHTFDRIISLNKLSREDLLVLLITNAQEVNTK